MGDRKAKFKRGDVVRFKSGGFPMTVNDYVHGDGDRLNLIWHAKDGEFQHTVDVHVDCLEPSLPEHPYGRQ